MGAYVYALNTKVKTISNVTVGVAEYQYKEYTTNSETDTLNQRLYNRFCKRRVEYFSNNKLPFFFVMRKLEVGTDVYSHLDANDRLVGPCFDCGAKLKKVGTIKKVGTRYEIDWI
jgi:hypothetical protein